MRNINATRAAVIGLALAMVLGGAAASRAATYVFQSGRGFVATQPSTSLHSPSFNTGRLDGAFGVSDGCVKVCAVACAMKCIFPCRWNPWGDRCTTCVDGCMDDCAVEC